MKGRLDRLIYHLLLCLFLVVITFCLVFSYSLSDRFTLALIVFNVFFASLFFQLNGSRITKTVILAAGNLLGLFWSWLFQKLAIVGYSFFGDSSNVVFSIIYPILTLLWMVPFWSISLSFLPQLTTSKEVAT